MEMNVEHEVYDQTSNNWSHPNNSKMFQEKFGSHTRKKFIRFITNLAILGTSLIIWVTLQSET
jgi:hypothetical protein